MSIVYQRIIQGYKFDEPSTSEHNQKHLYTWEEYKNQCIGKYESKNDLYMIVWCDKHDQPLFIRYASHGVESYPKHNSFIDASEIYIEKYKNWQLKEDEKSNKFYRSHQCKQLLKLRELERNVLEKHNTSIRNMRSVYDQYGYDLYIHIMTIVLKRFRNQFKQNFQMILVKLLCAEHKLSYYEITQLKGLKI